MSKVLSARTIAAVAALGIALLTGCAPPETSAASTSVGSTKLDPPQTFQSAQSVLDSVNLKQYCGNKPVRLAFVQTVGVSWYFAVQKMLEVALEKNCPNVTIQAVDSQGDGSKQSSDINSLVAQGINGIIIRADFPTSVPALQTAISNGVPVVAFDAAGGATPPKQVTDFIAPNAQAAAELWVSWLGKNVKTGKVGVFNTGAKGNQSALDYFRALKSSLKQHPGIELVNPNESDLPWGGNDPATVRSAASGFVAKYGQLDAVYTDYGAQTDLLVDAYVAAGMKPPAIATLSSTNGFECQAVEKHLQMISLDGTQPAAYIALGKLLAAVNGVTNTQSNQYNQFVAVDTSNPALQPKCNRSLSPDIDWSLGLTDSQLAAVFK